MVYIFNFLETITEEDINEIMRKANLDGDATLTYEEFYNLILKYEKQLDGIT